VPNVERSILNMTMKLLSLFKRQKTELVAKVKEGPPKVIQYSGGYTTVTHWRITGIDPRCKLKIVGTNDCYHVRVWSKVATLAENKKNLLTNPGRDWMHSQVYTNTATGTRASGFISASSDATAPNAADVAVAGELAVSGFTRADAVTKTHTVGTNSTLIEHTFTASGTVTAIQKTGLHYASSGSNNLTHENTIISADVVSGDTLKISWTVNLG
jgi:hypothetical protein